MKKWLFLLIPVLVIGCGEKKNEAPLEPPILGVVMKKETQESIGLQTANVEKKKLVSFFEAYGSIAQDTENTVHVAPKEKGVLKQLKVAVGQTVDEKTPIAVIETPSGEKDLLSPCHGTVISQYGKEGDSVDPLSPVFTIADPDVMRVSFDVYEKDWSTIQLDQRVKVASAAFPGKVFEGKVVFISPRVDESTRTIKIRVDVGNKEHLLKFGMFVNGKILKESEEDSLIVPREAIQNMENGDTVFVAKDGGTFEARVVEAGAQTDTESVIVKGLNEGETIVTRGSFVLKGELLKSEMGEE